MYCILSYVTSIRTAKALHAASCVYVLDSTVSEHMNYSTVTVYTIVAAFERVGSERTLKFHSSTVYKVVYPNVRTHYTVLYTSGSG